MGAPTGYGVSIGGLLAVTFKALDVGV